MAAANKTAPGDGDVAAWLAALEPGSRRTEAQAVCDLLARVAGEPPVLWGTSIIGVGRYQYRHDSGRTGEAPRIGFSPRKAAHVFYLHGDFPGQAELLARLGKHSTGVGCLYIKRLADIDPEVLESLCAESLKALAARYPP